MIRISTILILCLIFPSLLVYAESNDNKFDKIDALLSQLNTATVNVTTKSKLLPNIKVKPVVDLVIEHVDKNNLLNQKKSDSALITQSPLLSKREEVALTTEQQAVLKTKISELPPSSRFYFTKTLFIPAYKKAIIYTNNKLYQTVGGDVDVVPMLLAVKGVHTCALFSDKSYVLLRGVNNQNKKITFLDVDNVKLLLAQSSGVSTTILVVDFVKKKADKNTVHIKLMCVINKKPPMNFTLNDLNNAVDGLFEFNLPKYIEL